jgi:hypothetical protein
MDAGPFTSVLWALAAAAVCGLLAIAPILLQLV